MRKTTVLSLVLVLVLALGSAASFAEGAPRFSARFNAFGLLVCAFPVSGEYALNDNLSLTADIFYSPNIVWVSNISIFDLEAGARYYFGSLLPDSLPPLVRGAPGAGPFAGARLGFVTETWKPQTDYKGTYTSMGLGAEVGYRYFFKADRGLYAEGFIGGAYYFPSTWKWTTPSGSGVWTDSPGWNPSRFTYGATIGYSF